MNIPKFETKKELFAYLKENQEDLIYQKKCATKEEDSVVGYVGATTNKPQVTKGAVDKGDTVCKVRAIINTTNWMDSHKDVHVAGIWNRSIKNNKSIKHLQEHQMQFDKIISDKGDLNVFVKEYDWKDLGHDYEGKTQALVFDSDIKADRNPYMFKQYKDGNVDNHSVGMRYVNIKLAINSDEESDKEQKAVWDSIYPDLANKEEADKHGYFWAVYEAKVMEGSAVVVGSNVMTPTQSREKHIVEEEAQPDLASLEEKAIIKFLNS